MPVDEELLRLIAAIRNSHPDMEWLYMNGQCYNFALIIRAVRPQAEIRYSHVEGHVYTEVDGRLYDIRGVKPKQAKDYPNIVKLDHQCGDRPHRWGSRDRRRLIHPSVETVMQPVKFLPSAVVMCPHCSEPINIEWYVGSRDIDPNMDREFITSCGHCDHSFKFHFNSRSDITFEPAPQSQAKGLMLVKHSNKNSFLYLVIEQTFYFRDGAFKTDIQYWIDSHTCPTNWLAVRLVSDNGNCDPHGAFEFVRAYTYDQIKEQFGYERGFIRGEDDSNIEEEEALVQIFPELRHGEEMLLAAANARLDAAIANTMENTPEPGTLRLLVEYDEWIELIGLLSNHLSEGGMSDEQLDHLHDILEYRPNQNTHPRSLAVYLEEPSGTLVVEVTAYGCKSAAQRFTPTPELLKHLHTLK